jgi:hypothetical protein
MSIIDPDVRDRLRHQGIELSIELDHQAVVRLRRAAAARDVPLDYLVRNLLGTIADGMLVDAVLDDAPPVP